MRSLWHEAIIPALPDAQLAHLHRSLCSLRGNGYGRSRALSYVWRRPYRMLYQYHVLVLSEMRARGWKPSIDWNRIGYRGRKAAPMDPELFGPSGRGSYPEHDNDHYVRCLEAARSKARTPSDFARLSEIAGV